MIKALKVALIVAAIVALFWGIMMIVAPDLTAEWNKLPKFSSEAKYLVGLLGAVYIALAVGFFLASRDPIRNITWVQAGLVSYGVSLLVTIFYLAKGSITFSQSIIPLIIQIVFLAALAVLYPRKQT